MRGLKSANSCQINRIDYPKTDLSIYKNLHMIRMFLKYHWGRKDYLINVYIYLF